MFSEDFFPKYLGLFVNPEGFECFFLKDFFLPLKPKSFFSPSLAGLSILPFLKDFFLSLKLDFFSSLNFLFLLFGPLPLLLIFELFLRPLGAGLKFGFINLFIEFHIDLSSGVRKVKADPSDPALAVLPIL